MAGIYRQRHPEHTVFYRVFFYYFELFLRGSTATSASSCPKGALDGSRGERGKGRVYLEPMDFDALGEL